MKAQLLTARRVAEIIRTRQFGWHHDGGGLYLVGSEEFKTFSWTVRIYRNTVTGKPRDLGIGPVRDFTLQEARDRAKKYRQLALDGIDPIEARRRDRDAARAATADRVTFKQAATEFLALHNDTWKNERHRQQWANSLNVYVYPTLGSRPIAAIDGALITEALLPIWTSKPETARRVKQRIERVVQWVKDGKPLPQKSGTVRVKHHAAASFAELPAFMAELRQSNGMAARALEFAILTAARTSEVLGAKWSEFDLVAGVWTVPAERMKAGKEHEVPLSKRALALLDMPRDPNGYVFPGAKTNAPLGDKALRQTLQNISGNGLTVHGFRSTFRDWAGDKTNFARDVVEHALAHAIKDKTEAAYRRSAALEKRRKLMEAWSQHCASDGAAGQVVALHA